jgi:hypothetical protein
VVIDVKDHKLAFDPNIWGASGTSATVDFLIDHEHERHSLAEVIEAPDRFRPLFANEDAVGVRMSNSWNGPGLFLNRFDRRSVQPAHVSKCSSSIESLRAAVIATHVISIAGCLTLTAAKKNCIGMKRKVRMKTAFGGW